MRLEHQEIYEDTFFEGFASLQKVMSIKLYSIEQCNNTLNKYMASGIKSSEVDYDLKVMTTAQIEKLSMEEIAKSFKTGKAEGFIKKLTFLSNLGSDKTGSKNNKPQSSSSESES